MLKDFHIETLRNIMQTTKTLTYLIMYNKQPSFGYASSHSRESGNPGH